MTPSAKHIIAAAIMGAVSLTATISFSAYHPERNNFDAVKSDILVPLRLTAPNEGVRSAALLKQDRAAFGLTLSDREGIKDAIIKQIGAFASGDAKTAYDLAAPIARADYDSADQFLNDLSDIYGLLTVAKVNRMDGLDLSDGTPRQRMLLTSPSGQQWIAHFSMEKHVSGNWKVLGFMIEDAPGAVI